MTGQRWLRLAVALIGWAICAPLLVIAVARVESHDSHLFFVWANAYTFWIYLPAYGVAIVALLFRRALLVGAAALLVAAHLWWVLPDYAGATPIPAAAWSAPRLRLFSANIRFDNEDFQGIMAEAISSGADVIFFQEFTQAARAAAETAGIDASYPYNVGTTSGDTRGAAIYSRLPLIEPQVWLVEGIPMARADVEVGGQVVHLFNVHPVSPTKSRNVGLWDAELGQLARTFSEQAGNVIAAGDFNMTQHQKWYGVITGGPLHDAHVERGKGNATTWPNGQLPLPAIRIDQVFISATLICLDIHEGVGQGSDHRPVITDIAVLP